MSRARGATLYRAIALAVSCVILLSGESAATAVDTSLCTFSEINSGACVVNGVINADRVDLIGSGERAGVDPIAGTDDVTDSGSGSGAGSGTGSGDSEWRGDCTIIVHDIRVCIVTPGEPGSGGSEPRSVSDIASFIPRQPTMTIEPAGWSFVGLHVNCVALASSHIVEGQLWGSALQVRFTPVRYRWDYGDGAGAWESEAGKTWAQSGVEPWAVTTTSRPYRQAGNYTIRLIVDHRAEWRWAGSSEWHTLSGFVGRTAPSQKIRVIRGSTVLVDSPR
ncbi:MAG: hypothetical protein ACKOWP_04730 [Microbacteriaceae bacterium]